MTVSRCHALRPVLLWRVALFVVSLLVTTIPPASGGSPESPVTGAAPQRVDLVAVGDIMVHETQLKTHYVASGDTYLFDDDFRFIRPWLQSADLAIGNLETVFGGTAKKYSGYPFFNTPDTLAEALARAGFDVLTVANNHALDMGVEGAKRTVEVVRRNGMDVIGGRARPEDDPLVVREVRGVRVGLLGLTYETGSRGSARTLNGTAMPPAALSLLETFRPFRLAEDLPGIEGKVKRLRDKGAELVVAVLHWGEEYGKQPTAGQRLMVSHLASAGVDLVFGHHAHVVQKVEVLPRPDGGRMLVAWSLGNFLSNQRYEFLQRRDTEDGLLMQVTVERATRGTPWRFTRIGAVPLWVHRHQRAGTWRYHILPLANALADEVAFGLDTADGRWRARNSWEQTLKVLGPGSASVPIAPPLPEGVFDLLTNPVASGPASLTVVP
ncbi:MAG: CapA family protein [Candidatus Riflebacteria bacterium]|nr:CapA family protein [Candidatus Riflebacteria bacterium]